MTGELCPRPDQFYLENHDGKHVVLRSAADFDENGLAIAGKCVGCGSVVWPSPSRDQWSSIRFLIVEDPW